MNALILGCGYLGRALACSWIRDHAKVTGWVRTESSAAELQVEGIRMIVGDLSDPNAWTSLDASYDVIVHCASSGRGGIESYRAVYREGLRLALQHFPATPLLFVSSTSVYGQTEGELVDETSPALPGTETGKILREAETLGIDSGAIILRVAGIYGPGRGVLRQRFLEGKAVIEGDGLRWMNQVHRDDIVSAIHILYRQGQRGGIYNICDNHPCTHLEYFQWLAEQYQRPLPPYGPVNTERKRGVTNKRVQNAKLRALGWVPRYPSFRESASPYAP